MNNDRVIPSHPPSLLSQTRSLLREFGLHARKGLGQHYLIDEWVLKRIVAAAELKPEDLVMEVGPGLGVLTRELAKRAGWVITIELDKKLADILQRTLAPLHNINIVNKDILQVEPADLLQEMRPRLPGTLSPGYKVVANLPYYITSPVLRLFLEARFKPDIMVVMVQKEVAEAIVAKPGDMSILSVSVQFYGRPQIVGYVPARAFYPAPEVDSAILRIDLYPAPPVNVTDIDSFFKLVRAGFSAARKQILNSLAQGLKLPKPEVLEMLDKAGIEPRRRAETLSIEEWARLWQEFVKVRK